MTEQDTAAPSERTKRIAERKARMRALNPPGESVRVNPASDELRKALKHPTSGMKFPAEGSAEWPLDAFTKRRLADGSVTREEQQREAAPASQQQREAPLENQQRHRRQSAPAD